MSPDDRLAAEVALGLLDGQELLDARGRIAGEPAFARAVEWWELRLAPLLDEIPAETPPDELFARIVANMDSGADGGEVVALQRRVRFWQRATAAGAIAACAAMAALVLTPQNVSSPADAPRLAAAPLVASIPIGDTPLRLGVTYLPDRGELLVSASGLTADGVHDHELWLVPDDGQALRSLGVVQPGAESRVSLDAETAALIHDGSAMVLTREPLGGKPPEAAAGPVVAEGAFDTI